MFGNDHLPSSLEIGPELGLNFFLKCHYKALKNNNIINLKKLQITINLQYFSLYLQNVNETNKQNITKIILQRYFKINFNLINTFVDKFNFSFDEILDFMKKFIIYQAVNMDINEYNNLDDNDLRKYLTKDINKDYLTSNNLLDDDKQKILLESICLIETNIDYYEHEFFGLILYNKPINISNDSYKDLYTYISDQVVTKLNNKYVYLYEHINIYEHIKQTKSLNDNVYVNDYLKKMFHLTTSQFGNMKDFHNDNITFYKYYNVPSINNIILFILNTIENNQTQKWTFEILNDNINKNYLNSINHHLLISPIITLLTDNEISDLKYRNIDINNFL